MAARLLEEILEGGSGRRPEGVLVMGIGVSVFLLVLGAIFRFAIKSDLVGDNVDLHVIGVILMVAGAGTFLLQILMMSRSNQPQQHNERLYNGDNNPPNV